MKIVGFIFFLFSVQQLFAQEYTQVISDEHLDSLVAKSRLANIEAGGMQGFRIQIFFGSDRKEANEARTKFLQLFPETEAYLVYQAPYYKVRVGDYRNQLEAQPVYRKVLTEFEKVFIVPDKVNWPKL